MAGNSIGELFKVTTLDLNNPTDAREFISKALPEALPDRATVDYFILVDGRKIDTKTLSDSEAVQYAWELLPIYQAAFPALCEITYEH